MNLYFAEIISEPGFIKIPRFIWQRLPGTFNTLYIVFHTATCCYFFFACFFLTQHILFFFFTMSTFALYNSNGFWLNERILHSHHSIGCVICFFLILIARVIYLEF